MTSKRIFMAGLGAGVIIGALLLQLVYAAQMDIGLPSDEKLYTEEEVAQLLADAKAAASPEPTEEADLPEPTDSAEAPNAIVAPSSPAEPERAATPEPPAETFQLRIYPGSSLSGAAELLIESGVLESDQEFIALMKKKNAVVRAGWFEFHKGMTAKEVADVVTGQPVSRID